MSTMHQRCAQIQTRRAAGQVPKDAMLGSRRVAYTVHAKQQQQQQQQQHQPFLQQQQRSRSIAVTAAATETVSATATTASPGWLKSLLPFGRKQAEPLVLIPTVSRAELDVLLQASNSSAEACSQVPLVVIFSATWCGPCKVMMQRLESIAKQLGPDGVKVVKIDTDESQGGAELATELKIYKLPTLMFCGPNDGKGAVQVQGLVKEAVLLDMVLNKSQFMGNDLAGCMKW